MCLSFCFPVFTRTRTLLQIINPFFLLDRLTYILSVIITLQCIHPSLKFSSYKFSQFTSSLVPPATTSGERIDTPPEYLSTSPVTTTISVPASLDYPGPYSFTTFFRRLLRVGSGPVPVRTEDLLLLGQESGKVRSRWIHREPTESKTPTPHRRVKHNPDGDPRRPFPFYCDNRLLCSLAG